MKYFKMIIIGVAALFLSISALIAGEIQGTIFDASTRQPLRGVNIFMLPDRVKAATSDERGEYRITSLSAGSYQLMASYIGYNIQTREIEVADVGVVKQNFEIILSALDVETPVVAASKREQTLIEAPSSVSVLFSQDVAEADEATTLAEVLKLVPGLDYAKAYEGHYNITARGFNNYFNNTMLLLIDGRTLNTAQNNHINWAGIPISEDEIDRIEVIKGPGAALYGANAFSGVINVITKSPRAMTGTTVSAAAGSRGTFSGSFTQAGSREKLAYKISGGFFENDDFFESAGFDTIAGLKPAPENFRVLKADARAEYQLSDDTQFTTSGGFVAQKNLKLVASSASVNTERENDFYVSGKLRHRNLSLQSYYNSIRTDTLRASGSSTVILTNYDIYRFDLQQGLNLGRSKLILGGEYQWQRFDSKGLLFPAPVVQNLFGLYGQLETRLRSNFSLILAGRVDHHPTVGFQVSPKVGLIYTLFNVHSFRLTANQAYVNPVLVELFTDFSIEFIPGLFIGLRGNRNLEPRKITALELGYQGFLQKKFKINLDIYQQELKDFISPPRVVNRSDPNAVSFVNFGQVRATGVDLGLLYLIRRGLSLSFNLSAIGTDKSPVFSNNPDENTINKVPTLNAPKHKLSSVLRYETRNGFYGSVAARFVEKHDWTLEVADPFPRTILKEIKSYFVPDLAAGYRAPNDDFRISVTASNLFDKKHQEIPRGGFIRRKIIGSFTTHF